MNNNHDPRRMLAMTGDGSKKTSEVSKETIAKFNTIHTKKTKLDREREAAAKKAKEEEESAAKAYEEFVASFEVEESSNTPKFAGRGFVKAGGGEYRPPKMPTRPVAPKAMRFEEDEPEDLPLARRTGKPKAGDQFLQELKSQQKEREERLKIQLERSGGQSSITALAAREHAPVLTGSYDAGDPLTTNVHVGGLPPTVNEQALGMLFAKYGDVGSVKIMWPRVETQRQGNLGGFVAMMRRPDAEVAAKEVDGLEWQGSVLRTSWGKAVPIPLRALYEFDNSQPSSRKDRGRSRSRSPRRGRSPSRDRRGRSYSRSPKGSPKRHDREWPILEAGVDKSLLESIQHEVEEYGMESVERRIRSKDNPKYAFMHNKELPSYHYFKMLCDFRYQCPVAMLYSDEGPADAYSSNESEDSEREKTGKGNLGVLARNRFETMLRGLTSTREKIARGMAFALEHADVAPTIVDIIIASLKIDSTPVPRKIARLHLVSDILHNSASPLPNAWVYRSTFESRLGEVFDHLGQVYQSFPGRIKAEQFKIQVTSIIDVWEHEWMTFSPTVIEEFRRRLDGLSAEAEQAALNLLQSVGHMEETSKTEEPASTSLGVGPKFSKAGFSSAGFAPIGTNEERPDDSITDIDGQAVDLDGEALDGDPIDVDGEAINLCAEAVDGEVIDLDGSVVDMDIDGEEIEI